MSEDNRRGAVLAGALLLTAALAAMAAEPPVRDPTRAPGAGGARLDPLSGMAWVLRSTHVSSTARSAVINDSIVAPGSRVNGAEVIAIDPGRVQLRRGKELITLRLQLPYVKRPAEGGEES